MQVKVEIVGPDSNIPPADRKNIVVDVHARRGDTFHVLKSHSVLEGDAAQVFTVPAGGRLVVTTPEANEEVVYDRDQGAAVKTTAQANAGLRADRVSDNVRPQTPPPPQGTVPPNPSRIQSGAPQQPQPRIQTQQQPFTPPGTQGGTDAAAKAQADAKAAQQSGAGRPAGEKPPLPGSPVGSPPHGNEGNKGP